MRWILAVVGLVTGVTAAWSTEWQALPGMTSAALARAGWRQIGSAGLSWPDGRQAVVSFWEGTFPGKKPVTFRCVTYFDKDLQQTGDVCYQPTDKE